MTSPIIGNCGFCKHLHRDLNTCDAFPDGIPIEIQQSNVKTGKMPFDHRKPYPGDNGVRFEIRDELSKKIDVSLLFSE
jgi:hypothetical protein